MLFNELVGFTASLFILLAFTNDDMRLVRIYDSIGCVLFVIYGILIHSISTVFLNIVMISLQIYKLRKLKRSKEISCGQE